MPEPLLPVTTFFTTLAPSILAFSGFAVLLAALGLAKTKDTLTTILIAVYVGALIAALFPYYTVIQLQFSLENGALARLVVFGLSSVGAGFALSRYVVSNYQYRALWRTIEVITLGVMVSGLVFTMLHHIVGIGTLVMWWPASDALFTSTHALAFWLIAPVLSFPLFVRP